MILRKLIGLAMIAAPFTVIVAASLYQIGLEGTLIVFSGTAALAGSLIAGVFLAVGRS